MRRLWKCPACNRAERTSGGSTSNWCACQIKNDEGFPLPMVLAEDGVRRVLSPPNSKSDPLAPEPLPAETSPPDAPPDGDTPRIE
jgi:hypothetical protein